MRYPVRRDTLAFRLLFVHTLNVIPYVGVGAMLLAALFLIFGIIFGAVFMLLPLEPLERIPLSREAPADADPGTADPTGSPVTMVIHAPMRQSGEFLDNVASDIANHGGRTLEPFRISAREGMGRYLVPAAYPSRLLPLAADDMDHRAWSAWAARTPVPDDTGPAGVTLDIEVRPRCLEHCVVRATARVALLIAATALAVTVGSALFAGALTSILEP